MSTVLVTGGAGYIGSHVVKELLERGDFPIVFDNLQSGHRRSVKDALLIEGDLQDSPRLIEVFKSYRIHSVMHLAASSLVGESVEKPLQYFNNNLRNSINLLEIMDQFDVRKIVFSSSAAVYGEPKEIPITEDHPCSPTNPYGETKWMFEKVLSAFHEARKINFISLRYFNAAGADPSGTLGEDHAKETHLIPIGLLAALKNQPVPVFGQDYQTPDGTCIRDYIHVNDLAQAHILALKHLESGGASAVYNLGNGNGYSVKEVIDTMRRLTGKRIITADAPRRPGDPARLVAGSEKIRADLGWTPEFTDLETIVRTAWKWHRMHPDGYEDIS